MNIYMDGYNISRNICSIYIDIISDYLTNNCSVDKYKDRLRLLRNLISLEDIMYDRLDEDMVDNYIDYTYLIDYNDDKFVMDRYYRNLEERKLKLSNNLMIDDNLSFNGFFDGTLIMYVLKRMYYNINDSLNDKEFCNDNFANTLMDYFISQMFFYLTTTKYSEKMALKYNFDIRRLPSFDKDKFLHIVESVYMDIDDLIIPFANRDIDNIFSFYRMDNNLVKVFSNLYNFCDLEVLMMMLDDEGIDIVDDYYNSRISMINNIDKYPEISNIKRLIRKRDI